MYERMLDKSTPPTPEQIADALGTEAGRRLAALEEALAARYSLSRSLRFPFGNQYGWGYKYQHKQSHLCYGFFENGAFTLMLQLGDGVAQQVVEALPQLQPATRALWQNRYPCGQVGGWVHLRVLTDADLQDALLLLSIKKRPVR